MRVIVSLQYLAKNDRSELHLELGIEMLEAGRRLVFEKLQISEAK
jgi:hypothetical protein